MWVKFYCKSIATYSSLSNRRVVRNKRDGRERWAIFNYRGPRNKRGVGKDESFLISVVPGISIVVRIFRPVTVIKRRTKWNKVLIKKQKNEKIKKWHKRIISCLWHKTVTVCSLFVFDSLLNIFAWISQSFAWFLHVGQ